MPKPDTVQRWATRNPLWKWRIANRATRETVGQLLGVSDRTVSRWEHGITQPNGSSMGILADLIGPEVYEDWAGWLSRRPEIPRPFRVPRAAVEALGREGIAETLTAAEELARQLDELNRQDEEREGNR